MQVHKFWCFGPVGRKVSLHPCYSVTLGDTLHCSSYFDNTVGVQCDTGIEQNEFLFLHSKCSVFLSDQDNSAQDNIVLLVITIMMQCNARASY